MVKVLHIALLDQIRFQLSRINAWLDQPAYNEDDMEDQLYYEAWKEEKK